MVITNLLEDSDIWADVVEVVIEHNRRYRGQGQSNISC